MDLVNAEVIIRISAYVIFLALISFLYWYLGIKFIRTLRRKWRKTIWALISTVLGLVTLFLMFSTYVYYGFGYQPDIYRTGNRNHNKVAITFDDGPSEEFTLPILEILNEYDVPATFFMVGSHVEKYPHVARKVVDEGHAVGNHTQNHRNLPTLSTFDLHQEIVEATAVITEVTGSYPTYIRPPRGMYDGRSRRLSNLLGQEIVLWSISTRDWRYGVTASYIVRLITAKVKGGDIILFHDSGALLKNEGGDRQATVLALPGAIEAIRAKGLEIVPLEELLHDAPLESFPNIDRPE